MSESVWLVDYDLTVANQARRRAFYREVRKLMRELDLNGSLSTFSVVVVRDEVLARRVFNLASRYGRAHLYRAEQVV